MTKTAKYCHLRNVTKILHFVNSSKCTVKYSKTILIHIFMLFLFFLLRKISFIIVWWLYWLQVSYIISNKKYAIFIFEKFQICFFVNNIGLSELWGSCFYYELLFRYVMWKENYAFQRKTTILFFKTVMHVTKIKNYNKTYFKTGKRCFYTFPSNNIWFILP